MRKKCLILLLISVLFILNGCSSSEDSTTFNTVFEPEDFDRSNFGNSYNTLIHETDNGYYYLTHANGPGLRYMEKATGKSIYLCNKPECAHDGNEFCVATTSKYGVISANWYNESIILLAIERAETRLTYKLLRVSSDGSRMDELATILNVDNTNLAPLYFIGERTMLIHRNKALVNFTATDETVVDEDSTYYGSAVVDLNTKEVTYLFEEPLSKVNQKYGYMSAIGDYIYFNVYDHTKKSAKNSLSRYCISSNTTEKVEISGYCGKYTLIDEDRIGYLRPQASKISVYSVSAGTTKDYDICKYTTHINDTLVTGEVIDRDFEESYKPTSIACDGKYFYIGYGVQLSDYMFTSYISGLDFDLTMRLFVYDLELSNCISNLDMFKGTMKSRLNGLSHIGDKVYLYAMSPDVIKELGTTGAYVCDFDSFLKGNFEYEVCPNFYDISRQELEEVGTR